MERIEEINIIIQKIVYDLEKKLKISVYQHSKIDYIITAGKLLGEYKCQLEQLEK